MTSEGVGQDTWAEREKPSKGNRDRKGRRSMKVWHLCISVCVHACTHVKEGKEGKNISLLKYYLLGPVHLY